ncbi:MAG: hypothetical protein K9G48_14110 [Reyranella sp.]|nr:hypothetical protein [Reyranella sp.]
MRDDTTKLPGKLIGRGILATCVASVAVLGLAGGAEAGDRHGRGHGNKKYRGYYAPAYVAVPPGHVHYYAPAPVYYAPRPVAVYPAPVVYAPAYPVYAAPVGSLSLGLTLPLR